MLCSDPKFNILCDKRRMEKREADGSFVPQIISIPPLPGVSMPKGFECSTSRKYFLLSKEGYELCMEVDDLIGKKSVHHNKSAGFVLSGPSGIGKSGIGLLLASYA